MMPNVSASVDRFLRERPTATLATIRRDGSPQLSVLWYLWEPGEFVMSTVNTTAKWHNLRRDPRCSVCVEEPESGRMVVAYGSATLDDGNVRHATRELVSRYYATSQETDAHIERIFSTDDRVLIRLVPTQLVTRRLD